MRISESKHQPIELLRYAGLFTWLCASIPLILMRYWYETPLAMNQYVTWWVLHLIFGLTYWNQVKVLPVRSSLQYRLVTVSLLTACALGISMMAETSLGGILLLIVAGLLPWMLAPAPAMSWLIGQNVLLVAVLSNIPDIAFKFAALIGGLFLGISLFAFMSGVVALRQNAARDELRKVNSELRATQALLEENTRIAERVRIARELHDLVGHHLTALTLNLEVATHLVDGKALEHVQQAHSGCAHCSGRVTALSATWPRDGAASVSGPRSPSAPAWHSRGVSSSVPLGPAESRPAPRPSRPWATPEGA